jgi:hypothetical protein
MTPSRPESAAIAARAADAVRLLREATEDARRLIAGGSRDEALFAVARMLIVPAPPCPKCARPLIGSSPTICRGCEALVAWDIETRVVR